MYGPCTGCLGSYKNLCNARNQSNRESPTRNPKKMTYSDSCRKGAALESICRFLSNVIVSMRCFVSSSQERHTGMQPALGTLKFVLTYLLRLTACIQASTTSRTRTDSQATECWQETSTNATGMLPVYARQRHIRSPVLSRARPQETSNACVLLLLLSLHTMES